MTNNHCDYVPIEYLLELQEQLDLFDHQLVAFCGVSSTQQLRNWKKKGKVPAVRYWTIQNELARFYKNEYDKKMKMIWRDYEE